MERRPNTGDDFGSFYADELPVRKTRFYLLNGNGERVYFVDEYPQPISPDFRRSTRYLPAVVDLRVKGKANVDPLKDNTPTIFTDSLGWGTCQKDTQNYYFQVGSWKTAVGKTETLFGCWKTPVSLTHKNGDGIKQNDMKNSKGCKLEDLPVEIFETLVQYLDGFAFFNACEASPKLEAKLYEALGAGTSQRWSYWNRAVTTWLHPHFMLKILTSFDGVVMRQERNEAKVLRPAFMPFQKDDFPQLYDYNWEDVGRSAYTLWEKLCIGKLKFNSMDKAEIAIKTVMQVSVRNKGRPDTQTNSSETYQTPKSLTQTCGPFLFNILSPNPWSDEDPKTKNWRVMENFKDMKIRRIERLHHEVVRYVRVMYVPLFDSKSSCEPGLPRAIRVMIGVCKNSIVLFPLQEGRGLKLSFNPIANRHWNMDPIVAIHENVFVTWQNPNVLQFYYCYLRDGTDGKTLVADLIRQVEIFEMLEHWERVGMYKNYVLPVLKKVKGSYEAASPEFQKQLSVDELEEDYYELHLVSLRCGRDIMGPRNPWRDINENNVINHYVTHQHPQYYLQNAIDYRDLLDVAYTCAQGCGMYVFWNAKAIGISWDGLTWLFESWEKVLEPAVAAFDHIVIERRVTHVDIFSPDGIAVIVNRNIVIFHMKKKEGGNIVKSELKPKGSRTVKYVIEEPKLILTPVRVIAIGATGLGLEFDQFSFDFDYGEPYIFLSIRSSQTECGLDFYMTRMTFEKEETGTDICNAKVSTSRTSGLMKQASNKQKNQKPSTSKTISQVKTDPPNTKLPDEIENLFDLSTYPKVLEQIEKFKKAKKDGIPTMMVKKVRMRYKGEPHYLYEMYLDAMTGAHTQYRTSSSSS